MRLIYESWHMFLEETEKENKIDIVDDTLYRVNIGDGAGPRYFTVVKTKEHGLVPFYQSSGKSTSDKSAGSWHIFLGFKPYKGVSRTGITLLKTRETIDMVNKHPEGELAKISKALEDRAFKSVIYAEESPEKDKFQVKEGDQIRYNEGLIQSAIGNKWLYDAGALDKGTLARKIDPETDFIGFEEIPISKLYKMDPQHSDLLLPKRYDLK